MLPYALQAFVSSAERKDDFLLLCNEAVNMIFLWQSPMGEAISHPWFCCVQAAFMSPVQNKMLKIHPFLQNVH